MTISVVYSRATYGIDAPLVTIEVNLAKGFPKFHIVGLPEAAVKESKHRVQCALQNSHFDFPIMRITVNLAPADLPKEGGRFDLPIALGILAASKQISTDILHHFEFAGELALTGELRPIKGSLPFALAASQANRDIMLPFQNTDEATLAENACVYGAKHLLEICAYLNKKNTLPPKTNRLPITRPPTLDLADVYGQLQARRALEIAAAGGHSLLLCGPPGTGKTMLASRLGSILPPLDEKEAQKVAAVYSVSHIGFDASKWRQRPYRNPHHTSSSVALVGGSKPPQPGEISLAHLGVLFLDELPEFNRHTLECLREPLESGYINISRAGYQLQFPAEFQLVAAMNPCPCGYSGANDNRCQCSPQQISRYRQKLSGPLLDRIDLHIELTKTSNFLDSEEVPENSFEVQKRVGLAHKLQIKRQCHVNAKLTHHDLSKHCQLTKLDKSFLFNAIEHLGLSARAYSRILKIARTIADLNQEDIIQRIHLQEALTYRLPDQKSVIKFE